jgi:hypothetical protein
LRFGPLVRTGKSVGKKNLFGGFDLVFLLFMC